jgi:sugar/nucleoside kinase (ribokinase family)
VNNKIDQATLKGTKQDSIIDICQREFNFSENEKFLQAIKYFRMGGHEMNFDFNYRTCIHDCLDFENIALVQDYRTTLIQYMEEIFFDSESAK